MKVSLIATLYNEEKTIKKYLDSLMAQTRKPDEIIIVDGGSTDKTFEIVRNYSKKSKVPIKIIVEKGAPIPRGRNIGIKNAKYDIIVGGDAGVVMPKDWLKNLLSQLSSNVDVVAGVYQLTGKTLMQKSIADVFQYGLLPDISKATDSFDPSNRSLAYRKKIWKKLGKYPENMKRSDDTWFNIEARKAGFKFKVAKNAVVYWKARKSLGEVFKYAFLDAESDMINKINPRRYVKYWVDIIAITVSAGIAVAKITALPFYAIIGLNILYSFYYSVKVAMTNGKITRTPIYIPIILMLIAATLSGMISGLLKK